MIGNKLTNYTYLIPTFCPKWLNYSPRVLKSSDLEPSVHDR